jgi:penicillin-binding protein 2
LFFAIFCKLFYVQIIEGGKFSGMSDSRRIRTVSIDTLRGTIYDRNGSVLAIDKHSFELMVSYTKLFNAFCVLNKTFCLKYPGVRIKE